MRTAPATDGPPEAPSRARRARRDDAEEREEDEGGSPVMTPTLPPLRVVGFALRQLLRHPWLFTLHLVAAGFVAAADVVSISLVLPFLETLGGGVGLPPGTPLSFLGPYMAGLSIVEKIRVIAVLLVLVQLVRAVASYAESRLGSYLGILFERDLRERVFDDLLRVDLRYLHMERTGRLVELMHTYPRQSGKLVRDYLGGISRVATAVVLVYSLFLLDWQLTIVGIGIGLLSLALITGIRKTVKRLSRRMQESRVRLQQASLESLHSMKLIRFFAREDHARARFSDEVRALQRQSYRNASLSAAAAPLQRTLTTTLFAALLFAATFLLPRSGAAWVLLLTVFLLIMTRLSGPLANFASRGARIANETPALEAIIDFLERPKRYLVDGSIEFGHLERGVRFEDVTFAYGDGPPVLANVSFDIRKGETVALVGESGSGKSTIVQLLSRLTDPNSGRILADGKDLRTLRGASWRRRVAVVSQDTQLFHMSVRENIRFGRLEATDAEVEKAARLANAHDFIAEMKDGYDTLVGERGARLSGGQAQRIAIARAILADPDVLVLDEATSALDTATERAVQGAIERVSRGRTVLAIAHRLSTIRAAHRIYVLERGRIVERGTHRELMALRGRYARFVGMQDLSEEGSVLASPPRRVVVESRPTRARVVLGDGTERILPLVVGANGTAGFDAVRLAAGRDTCDVVLEGAHHSDVALFFVGRDGKETRARVREVRAPGST